MYPLDQLPAADPPVQPPRQNRWLIPVIVVAVIAIGVVVGLLLGRDQDGVALSTSAAVTEDPPEGLDEEQPLDLDLELDLPEEGLERLDPEALIEALDDPGALLDLFEDLAGGGLNLDQFEGLEDLNLDDLDLGGLNLDDLNLDDLELGDLNLDDLDLGDLNLEGFDLENFDLEDLGSLDLGAFEGLFEAFQDGDFGDLFNDCLQAQPQIEPGTSFDSLDELMDALPAACADLFDVSANGG